MPYGKSMCFCDYCGGQVKLMMSEAEVARDEKRQGFVDAIKASIHCIRSKDYKTALEYADKASELAKNDPAPMLIRYVCWLESDFKKAASFRSIAESMRAEKESVALSDDEYKVLLGAYVRNYISERDSDLKRMFMTLKKVKPADIQNVNNYEHLKRLNQYFTDDNLKEAFTITASQCLDEYEGALNQANQLDQESWNALQRIRNEDLFKAAGVLFIDPSLKQHVVQYFQKYNTAINQKWEAAFKKGVSGDKSTVKVYRDEADSLLSWSKTIR